MLWGESDCAGITQALVGVLRPGNGGAGKDRHDLGFGKTSGNGTEGLSRAAHKLVCFSAVFWI